MRWLVRRIYKLKNLNATMKLYRLKDWKLWRGASDEKMEYLEKNHTWDYTERPKEYKVIGCKWIYKLKPDIPGVKEPRYEGILVTKDYAQTERVDCNEVFALVVKHFAIKLLLSAVFSTI